MDTDILGFDPVYPNNFALKVPIKWDCEGFEKGFIWIMADNKGLTAANKAKNDEFYTQIADIENELRHYKQHFEGKTVLCNCDDPDWSNFFKYFQLNFYVLGLKKLICTHFDKTQATYKLEITAPEDKNGQMGIPQHIQTALEGNGDFRSPECVALLDEADIVVTNPPFSLFRDYISLLEEHNKKYIIIGSQNNITYKEVFPLLQTGKVWSGYNYGDMAFKVPANSAPRKTRYWVDKSGQKWRSLGNIMWFTNLDFKQRHESIVCYKKYNNSEYPHYDNYNAINVNRVQDIPVDYKGVMGVPITFINKNCPEQFDIVGIDRYTVPKAALIGGRVAINGKPCYARVLIKYKDSWIASHPQDFGGAA